MANLFDNIVNFMDESRVRAENMRNPNFYTQERDRNDSIKQRDLKNLILLAGNAIPGTPEYDQITSEIMSHPALPQSFRDRMAQVRQTAPTGNTLPSNVKINDPALLPNNTTVASAPKPAWDWGQMYKQSQIKENEARAEYYNNPNTTIGGTVQGIDPATGQSIIFRNTRGGLQNTGVAPAAKPGTAKPKLYFNKTTGKYEYFDSQKPAPEGFEPYVNPNFKPLYDENGQLTGYQDLITNQVKQTPDGSFGANPLKATPQERSQITTIMVDGKPTQVSYNPDTKEYTTIGEAKPNGTTLPDDVIEQTAQSVANYEASLSDLSRFGGSRERILARAKELNPQFNAQKYKTGQALRNDYTSGKTGKNIISLNTAMGHLGTLQEAADALQSGDLPALNALAVMYGKQTGKSAPDAFEAVKGAVAGELATTFKGAAGTDVGMQEILKAINSAQSPDQTKTVVRTYVKLLESRLQALNSNWKKTMGTDYPVLDEGTQKMFDKIMGTSQRQIQPNSEVSALSTEELKRIAGVK